jgi:glutathione synthase
MHVLFILDPLPQLKAYKDSSVAMMRALAARGHTLSVAMQGDIYIEDGRVGARATSIELIACADLHGHAWWRESAAATEQELVCFDAIVMRKDPPFDMEYVYSTHLLEYAQRQGARVFNRGAAIRNHPEKLAITEFAEFAPPTLVSCDIDRLKAFHRHHQDTIVKPLDGMGGTGVFRLQSHEPNLNVILEMLTDHGRRTMMAQRYLPEISEGDKRVLLIDGKPVPYALARIPQAGDTRGNLAVGARAVAQPLSEHDRRIAEVLGPRLAQRGLLLVGLDIIGNHITEINVTSPTCFVEIADQTGFDVAGMFAEALERAALRTS